MKKTYISPNMAVVKLETTGNVLISMSDQTTAGADESLAPAMLNDDEIFQLFLIH